MDSEDKIEQLFLLEVLIDKVVLNDLPPETPIRVRVKFIEFPCFEITQQDFKKDEQPEADGNFNSGKSFLFPMVPLELIRNLQRHPLAVTVFKITEDAPLLPEIVGQTRVRMSEGMSEAVHTAMSCNCDNEMPISHTLTDTFSLRTLGEEVGTVSLFIRLSCFGQSIVTQFQLMGEKKAFLFKNSKADTAFQCKKPGKEHKEPEEPTKYDILPVAPFITSEDTCFDFYAPTCDSACTPVAWKVTPPKPAPCPVCETRPGCNKPPTCPPRPPVKTCVDTKPCPYKAPENPCRECGTTRPSKPENKFQTPCSTCGTIQPSVPRPNVSKNPCSTCGAIQSSVSHPIESKNQCATCGMTQPNAPPPKENKKTCYVCGTIQPTNSEKTSSPRGSLNSNHSGTGHVSPSGSANASPISSSTKPTKTITCSACGTVCPFRKYDEDVSDECTVCGTALNFKDSEDSNPSSEPPFVCAFCGTTNPPNRETKICCICGTTRPQNEQTKRCSVCGTDCPFIQKPKECSVCGMACPANDKLWVKCDPCPPVNMCPECGEELPTQVCPSPCSCPCDFVEEECECVDEIPNPPVRYDTTGALSPAFMGWPEKPPEPLLPSPYCQCGMEEGDVGRNSPRNSYGQGDCVGSNEHPFISSSPVYQTGSSPDVMRSSLQGQELIGDMRAISFSDQGIGGVDSPTTGPSDEKVMQSDGHGKGKKKRSNWTHKWGLQYPGIKFGHRKCVESLPQVPPYMGWLWNSPTYGLKYRKGWRPGAVGYTVSKMLNAHREAAGRPPIGSKAKSKWRSGRGRGGRDNGPQPPTLHIHRKEGAYYISMHPLDLGPDAENVPLQFKIPKREREEGEEGSTSSSEESELEIEFMAPGAFEVKKPPPEFKSFGTQYHDEDHTPKVKAPSTVQLKGKKSKKGKAGSKKGGSKKGKKGKVNLDLPKVDPSVLEMLKTSGKSPFTRKPTGFVRGMPDGDDDDDEAAKGVLWDADDPPTAVGKGRPKKKAGFP